MGNKSKSKSNSTSTQADNRIVADSSTVATGGATINNADASKIVALNDALLQAVGETQADGLKFISQMGADGIAKLTGSATNLFEQAGNNATQSLTRVLDSVDKLSGSSEAIARAAVASFMPTANKDSDNTMRITAIAAAVAVALLMLKRK